MSDPFVLRWKLDRPYLEADRSDDVYALVTIEPNPAALAAAASAATPPAVIPTHLILLVDVSGSMNVLIRHDPNAQKLGDGYTEGKFAHKVVSDVPSRREMACGVVQKMVERLHPDDLFTLIAFDDKAHVLIRAASPNNMDALFPALQKLAKVGGGGTRLGKAFEALRDVLGGINDARRTRKVVL